MSKGQVQPSSLLARGFYFGTWRSFSGRYA